MKIHNKLPLIGGVFLASLTCNLVAQTTSTGNASATPGSCEPGGGRHGNHNPFEKLNLTEDQKSQVKTVMQKSHEEIQTIKSNAALTPEQKDQQIQTIKQGTDQQIKTILNPDQYQQLQEMRANWKNAEKGKGDKEGKPGFHNPLEKLNLTEEQKAQVHPIMQKAREDMNAIKDNASLSPEQKKEQFHAIRESTDEKLKAILTPEQSQKFDEMKAAHKGKHSKGDKPETSASN